MRDGRLSTLDWFRFEREVERRCIALRVERETAAGRIITLLDYARASGRYDPADRPAVEAALIAELGHDPRDDE